MSRPISKCKVRLTTQVTASSTTISFQSTDANRSLTSVAMSDFGTYGYLVINPSGKIGNYGIVRFESWSVSGSTITIGTLQWQTFQGDDASGTAVEFPAGTIAVCGNSHHLWNNVVRTADNQTIAGVKTFSSFPITPSSAPSTNYQVANKKYVDDITVTGAPDMGLTTKGIGEKATDAQLQASAADGSGDTTAPLVATSTSFNQTPTANKVPVSDSSGKLAAGWGGSASTLATLNASAKVVEDPANATATPTGSKIPIAGAGGTLANGWIDQTTLPVSKKAGIVTTPVTVSNSNAETTLFTFTLAGGQLGSANILDTKLYISTAGFRTTGVTMTFKLKYGSTTVASAVINDYAGAMTSVGGVIQATLFGAGATNSQQGSIAVNMASVANGYIAAVNSTYTGVFGFTSANGTAAEDSTANKTYTISVTFSDADVNTNLTMVHGFAQLIAV